MAANGNTYQQQNTVSVPREKLLTEVVYNEELGKKDLKVFLILLTELDGYAPPKRGRRNDPNNFRAVNMKKIASELNLKKKDVETSMGVLEYEGIIEQGDSTNATNGWRFTF